MNWYAHTLTPVQRLLVMSAQPSVPRHHILNPGALKLLPVMNMQCLCTRPVNMHWLGETAQMLH